MSGLSLGNYVLFAGGTSSSARKTVIDVYDNSLTKQSDLDLNNAKQDIASAVVGDYCVFCGGYTFDTAVDIFKISK